MGVAEDFRAVVARLRGWGFKVVEYGGCYGRSNGSSWSRGVPIGHVNHHYVCGLNPSASYIESLVSTLANGETVNWFADVNGCAWLLGVGPMNHAGMGSSSVRDRVANDQAPAGPAVSVGVPNDWGGGNASYSGTEGQHPGDSTPWPSSLIDVMVAINAAEFMQWGYTAARAIHHYEHTNRKIDMSWLGGASGTEGGKQLRSRVAARMGTAGVLPPVPGQGPGGEDEDMPLSKEDKDWISSAIKSTVDERIKAHFGEAAVSNPGAALNAGVMKRCRVDDNTKFAAVAGYKPV